MSHGRAAPLTGLSEARRAEALRRFAVLRPHLEEDVPLARVARAQGIPLRTAQRWLRAYRQHGLAGLARTPRADRGRRRLAPQLRQLIEGLALCTPPPTAAAVHRQVTAVATRHGRAAPSYSTVYAVIRELDTGLVPLAHQGT